jgi:uncharacterized protein YjbI with pentapeptide repeats
MANQEQLDILKQGTEVWNQFRRDNATINIDLGFASLNGADLSRVNLRGVDLRRASLFKTSLTEADLTGANLWRVYFREADLNRADLSGADLRGAYLIGAYLLEADLSEADLLGADLTQADLIRANLRQADLIRVNFSTADLRETNFKNAEIGFTTFADTDLSQTHGLETVVHNSPSNIDTKTLQRSKGKIPEVFLRGCGLSDIDIEYSKLANPDLTNEDIVRIQYRMFDLRATQSIQIAPLFISYSHADSPFVDHLDSSLTKKGVRFWRDIHDATAGRLETQVDRAIRQNPTVLLVLSKNSLNSDWVQHEVRTARSLEKELGRDALCPVALDDSWKSAPWPARIMEQIMEYNILDFSGWDDETAFEAKFSKLLSGLDLFYKKPRA